MSKRKVVMVDLGESVDSHSGSSVLRKSYQQSPVGAGRKQPKVKATRGWEHREGIHILVPVRETEASKGKLHNDCRNPELSALSIQKLSVHILS